MATFWPEGSHTCSDFPALRYSPEALAAEPGELFKLKKTDGKQPDAIQFDTGILEQQAGPREEREASGRATIRRVTYGTDTGTSFWIRSVEGAVRSIGGGADILRVGTRGGGLYGLDAPRTCRAK